MDYKRFFCSFSGEDYSIIQKCPPSLINLFVAIGAFVLFIFVLCFVSLSLLFINLFEVDMLAAILAFFFAWMITNIYLLILYTLAKTSFGEGSIIRSTILPNVIKYGFIIFISLLITKPLEVFIFSQELDTEISVYKKVQLEKYNTLTQAYYEQESAQIKLLLEECKHGKLDQNIDTDKIIFYEKMLAQSEHRRKELTNKMEELVSNSSFYTQKVILLATKYPFSWFISFLVVIILLLPAVLKSFISSRNKFYQFKKEIERRIVLDDYEDFKVRYNRILQSKFGPNYTWIELYEDPPFNYTRKVDKKIVFSEEDFIKSLYHE